MKYTCNFYSWKSILLLVVLIILNNSVMAQVDTTAPAVMADTTKPAPIDTTAVMTDTTAAVMADTTKPAPTDSTATSSKKKRNSQIIIYGGGNSNQMGGSTEKYDANSGIGYHFGLAWKKGGFIYGQFGIRYNSAVYGINSKLTSRDTGDLKVQAIDIPLTAGINFLSFARIVSLRAYLSAIPSFTIGVSDNNLGIKKDNVNSFIFYGQAGLGVDITLLMIDIGYNYGFEGLLDNYNKTNPGQFYISLGVKF